MNTPTAAPTRSTMYKVSLEEEIRECEATETENDDGVRAPPPPAAVHDGHLVSENFGLDGSGNGWFRHTHSLSLSKKNHLHTSLCARERTFDELSHVHHDLKTLSLTTHTHHEYLVTHILSLCLSLSLYLKNTYTHSHTHSLSYPHKHEHTHTHTHTHTCNASWEIGELAGTDRM